MWTWKRRHTYLNLRHADGKETRQKQERMEDNEEGKSETASGGENWHDDEKHWLITVMKFSTVWEKDGENTEV